MNHKTFLFILLINTVLVSSKDFLVYIPQGTDERVPTNAHFRCMKESQDQIGMHVRSSDQGITKNSIQAFTNAKNAGLKIQIGFAPCRGLSPQQHATNLINAFGKNTIQKVWVFPFYLLDQCTWMKIPTEVNCKYLTDLLSVLKRRGFKVGISAERNCWLLSFTDETACPTVSSQLLAWITSDDQVDGKANFDNYKQIGGWKKPYMKHYEIRDTCGIKYFTFYSE